jgi:K+-transporting ATPase ATPase C chain
LQDRLAKQLNEIKDKNPDMPGPVPVELVTTSGSGLDPHISPQATLWQVPRIAHARKIKPEDVRAIVQANIEGRQLGLFGEPRLNVLLLNLALDRAHGHPVP